MSLKVIEQTHQEDNAKQLNISNYHEISSTIVDRIYYFVKLVTKL